MIKTFHGTTNYRKLEKYFTKAELNRRPTAWRWQGIDFTVTPHGNGKFTASLNHDVITFIADIMQKTVIPTHVSNVMEDLDQDTFVSGTTIPKTKVIIQADERLYNLCQSHVLLFGKEII